VELACKFVAPDPRREACTADLSSFKSARPLSLIEKIRIQKVVAKLTSWIILRH
jgi:hypothetical protein